MAAPRVIVVGAGPAGTRASETLVAAGLRPLVVDEAKRSGGQIYRRQPQGFRRTPRDLYGTEADRAIAVHSAFDSLLPAIDYMPDTLCWNVRDGVLHTVTDGVTRAWPFDALILACGATDRLLPMPGWTLPGVYSLGASQIALKSQACAIGRRVAFVGTGPLLYLVASQYVKAGARVAGVFDTSSQADQVRALPLLAARTEVLLKGGALLWRLRRAHVPIYRGVTPLEIEGVGEVQTGPGVAGLRVRLSDGRAVSVECDAVALGYHLRAETQLADLAECEFEFDEVSRQWLPRIDKDGRSSVTGIYLAGDGVRILGADGAELAGSLAATALLEDNGFPVNRRLQASMRQQQKRMDRFRRGLAIAFPWPAHLAKGLADETLVCRCEAITVGELRAAARQCGAAEVNRAKAFSRVGMGRCQGRYCGLASAELLAATIGTDAKQLGRLRGQAPVKPFSIAAKAGPK